MSTGPRLGSFGSSAGGRTFVAPLHASLSATFQPHTCRVCGEEIDAGALAWKRAWHVEFAHEACGYLKRGDEQPHEVRKPGSFSTYWEWACPECHLDSCSGKQPTAATDMRCARCRVVAREEEPKAGNG